MLGHLLCLSSPCGPALAVLQAVVAVRAGIPHDAGEGRVVAHDAAIAVVGGMFRLLSLVVLEMGLVVLLLLLLVVVQHGDAPAAGGPIDAGVVALLVILGEHP